MYFLRGNSTNVTYDDFNYTEVNFNSTYDNNIIPWAYLNNITDWISSWFIY